MKKHLFCTLALACTTLLPLAGQDFSRKFGKITNDEIDMTTYPKDTSAVAVYLYENTDIWYDFTPNLNHIFMLHRNYSAKIKILKPEGVDMATVEIPYQTSSSAKEFVSGFSISAYNRVNGKIVETKLKNSEVLTEQVSENFYLRKFTIPEVHVGTVIEYRYSLTSEYYYNIDPIRVQRDCPVIYFSSKVSTPEYFKFNVASQGHHPVSVKTSREAHPGMNFSDDIRTIVANDVPALVDEPFVWSVDDFRTKVTFELRSIEIPGSYYKNYTSSWKSIDEALRETSFNEQLKISCPLKDEVAAIVATTDDEVTRLRAILKLVLGRMNWNGNYSLWARSPRQRFNEGSGNSADVNSILNSALREGGFKTTPILLNPRQSGRLPYAHPSIDNIRTFILLITLSDGTKCVVDATNPGNDIDLIPVPLMVDRARIFGADEHDGWINLTKLPVGKQNVIINCSLGEDGTLTGGMTAVIAGSPTYLLKSRYREDTEEKHMERLEIENDITISSYSIEGLDTPSVVEKIEFARETESAGDYIYLDATVIPFMSDNILSQQERKLPVEFPYCEKNTLTAIMTIPEGYAVEELPQSVRMNTCEGGADFLYYIVANGNMIQLRFEYNLNRALFTMGEYPDLHAFFSIMTEKTNSKIILKKI